MIWLNGPDASGDLAKNMLKTVFLKRRLTNGWAAGAGSAFANCGHVATHTLGSNGPTRDIAPSSEAPNRAAHQAASSTSRITARVRRPFGDLSSSTIVKWLAFGTGINWPGQ
jgi:hypothetical protein